MVLLLLVQTNTYDAAGNVAETINPLGKAWNYAYDARNRKVQEFEPLVTDATANTTSRPAMEWGYDAGGRTIATIDARGNETDMAYDAANRATQVQQAGVTFGGATQRPTVNTTYDKDGNVLTVTDPNGHVTTNAYDVLNRLLTTTDAASITVTNTYDAVGNKLTVTDGKSQVTSFVYDGLNRNTTVTDAAGQVTTLAYDALNKTGRTDALGQETSYTYDVRNRLSNVTYSSSAAANSQRNYAYDNVGNLLSVTEPSKTAANVAYAYDALNRVVTETSQGKTHSYTYDLAGNRLSTVYGGTSRTILSTYDALNRLSTMTESGRTSSYGYDLNGNIAQKTAPNGDTEAYAYDALNRATIESAQTGGAVALFNYIYGYDLAGNVTSVAETYPSGLNNRTVTNSYDAINRLHVETVTAATNVTTTYEYDAGNNRTSKAIVGGATAGTTSYSYNNLNQLTAYSDGTRSVALTYDLNGNRSTRVITGGSDNGTDTYSYDFENRLIGLVKGTSGSAGTYVYSYDYCTRRITRDESAASGTVTSLVYSGGTSVQEYNGATPTLAVEYIRGSDYGGGVGGILYTLRSGSPSYTHENKRGDVVAKTDVSGALTYQAQYEAFGQQTATSGSTLDRQKSNSKDTDPTGLIDEGFRYRDLDTGMFITRDPAGFVDGPNLYTYVVQNPWTKFDPEGLNAWQIPGTNLGIDLSRASATQFSKDVVWNTILGIGNVAIGFGKTAYAFGQSIANAGPSVVNGDLSRAVSNISTSQPGAVTAVTGQWANNFIESSKTPEGAEQNIGGALTLVVGGVKGPKVDVDAPPTPKPTESPAPGAQSASVTKGETEEMVAVYRGVASDHLGYQDALEGKANPIGGPATPAEHNAGDTYSEYTSWTTDKSVAHEFATTSTEDKLERTYGVILEDKVPTSQLIESSHPVEPYEKEVLRREPVTGAKVQPAPKPEIE